MPERKVRTIDIVAVNEIRAAHGRLLQCLERPPGKFRRFRIDDDIDEAEFLLRRALAGMGIEVRERKRKIREASADG